MRTDGGRRAGPQVADEIGCLDQRPRSVEGAVQFRILQQRPAEQIGRYLIAVLVVVEPVHQDVEQLVPHLITSLVVRRAGVCCVERIPPVRGTEPQVGPLGLDHQALGRGLLVQPHSRLDRLHQGGGRLQPSHVRVGLDGCRGTLGDEIQQGAGLHALLSEARQNIGDVGQVGTVWPNEEHATPAVAEARVGIEQIGSAVQRDDGLPRARTAVDDQGPAGTGANDGVLVGRDGAEHVAHTR